MTSDKGKKIPNQFIIHTPEATYFQSYQSIIIKTTFEDDKRVVYLDEKYWNHSSTTSKYRNSFLGEESKIVEEKVKNGVYLLTNLN